MPRRRSYLADPERGQLAARECRCRSPLVEEGTCIMCGHSPAGHSVELVTHSLAAAGVLPPRGLRRTTRRPGAP